MNPSFEVLNRFRTFLGLEAVSASRLGPGSIGSAGRGREALFSGVAGPLRIDGEVPLRKRGDEGAAPPMLRTCRDVAEVGGARALVSVATRTDAWAVQPRSMSSGGRRSERRRRGRLGTEGAVSIPHEASARCGPAGVVSSSLLVKGPGVASGAAQGSLSNYRLKQTARGRSVAEAPRRSRAAA